MQAEIVLENAAKRCGSGMQTATAKKERSGDMQKILAVPKKRRDKQMTTGKIAGNRKNGL